MSDTSAEKLPPAASFRTTQWTRVMAASGRDSSADKALAELCEDYWFPIYSYIRRCGRAPEDAEDLTQDFFLRIIERRPFADLAREGGKFRSFLLKALDRALVDDWRRTTSAKRGAGKVISLSEAEERYLQEPVETRTPEILFQRNFAVALLERVYQRLRKEYLQPELFEALKPCLLGARADAPYHELAKQLGSTESAIKTHVHRMRARFRVFLREAVGEIVTAPEEIEGELRELLRVLQD